MLRRRAAGAVQAGVWTALPGRASPVLVSTLQLTAMQPGSLCRRSRKAPEGCPCSICSAVPRSTPKPQTQEGLLLFHIGANCRAAGLWMRQDSQGCVEDVQELLTPQLHAAHSQPCLPARSRAGETTPACRRGRATPRPPLPTCCRVRTLFANHSRNAAHAPVLCTTIRDSSSG